MPGCISLPGPVGDSRYPNGDVTVPFTGQIDGVLVSAVGRCSLSSAASTAIESTAVAVCSSIHASWASVRAASSDGTASLLETGVMPSGSADGGALGPSCPRRRTCAVRSWTVASARASRSTAAATSAIS